MVNYPHAAIIVFYDSTGSGRIRRYLSVYLPYIIIVGICIIFPLLSIFDILVPVLCLLNVISGTSCAGTYYIIHMILSII